MLEQFLNWYTESDFIINEQIRESLDYVEYTTIMGSLAILALLFDVIKNAVKDQTLISNQWVVSVLLLFIFSVALKPVLDGIAYVVKQTDNATMLSPDEKKVLLDLAITKKQVELSNELDSLRTGSESNKIAIAKKQVQLWVNDFKMAGNLSGNGSSFINNPFSGAWVIEEILGGFRALLKVYYVTMMNVLYLLIPLAYVFSVFKPAHFLTALGYYFMYGFVLVVINFIQWVTYMLFIGKTVGSDSLIDMVMSPGGFLIEILSIFLYLRAFWLARLIIPIKTEDTIGPMVGQALALATYSVMSGLKMSGAAAAKPKPAASKTDGPVEIT